MCDYCEKRKIILEEDFLNTLAIMLTTDIVVPKDQLDDYDTYGVFIDRAYLRLVVLDDCGCMDHGIKIKILYCPFCGDLLKN